MPSVPLDTDMLSAVIKLRDATVRQHALNYTQQQGPLAFSAFTRYEVLRGYKQQAATRQLANFAVFCQHSQILPVTDAIWDRIDTLIRPTGATFFLTVVCFPKR